MTKKVKKLSKLEIKDMFGNNIVTGNMVMFAKRRSLAVGIYIRKNKASYSVAVKKDRFGIGPRGRYEVVSNFTLIQAKELFLIEDPINKLNTKLIQEALEIVPKLKTGKHLSKDFDENISWGISEMPGEE